VLSLSLGSQRIRQRYRSAATHPGLLHSAARRRSQTSAHASRRPATLGPHHPPAWPARRLLL